MNCKLLIWFHWKLSVDFSQPLVSHISVKNSIRSLCSGEPNMENKSNKNGQLSYPDPPYPNVYAIDC